MTALPDQPLSRRHEATDERGDGESRRMTPLSPGAPAEPLIYQTQQRIPGEPGMFRPRRLPTEQNGPEQQGFEQQGSVQQGSGQQGDEPQPPTQALPAQDAPHYRRRDFSPEGRRAVPSWAPAYANGDGGYPSSERLDYQTLGHQEVRAAVERSRGYLPNDSAPQQRSDGVSPSAAAEAREPTDPPVTGAIPLSTPMSTPDQPLTRRQLRALREAQENEQRVPSGEEGVATGDSGAPSADEPRSQPSAWAGFAVPAQAPAENFVDPVAEAEAAPRDELPEVGESLDAWVAKVFDGQPEAPAGPDPALPRDPDPVALVEPPEPAHWDSGDRRSGTPSVFDELFAPPSRAEATPEGPATRSEALDPADPLAFLGVQPIASDRVDLPAPGAWAPPTAERSSWAPSGAAPVPVAPVPEAPVPEDAADPTAEEIVVEPESPDPSVTDGDVHPVLLDAEPVPAERVQHAEAVESSAGEPPVGHWTRQAQADDDQGTYPRDVGGGHGVVTTNALVLPSIPQQDLSGPLANTGEVLVTGSIDLPRSLSSTGAHPTQLDESRLDHELDPGDEQVVSADSQPIRAIRAVSTHTSTRGMMLNTKPRGNRSLTVLIIVTAALAVGVGVVLVVGLLNRAF